MNTYYACDITGNVRLVRKWDSDTLILGELIRESDAIMPYKLFAYPPTIGLNTKEAAVLTRQILKDRFPGIKFSVRVRFFSGGSSINIRWTGGPTTREVTEPLNALTGRGFDPMTDSTTSSDHLIAYAGRIYKPCFAFINCNRQEHPDPEATAGDFPWEFGDIHP